VAEQHRLRSKQGDPQLGVGEGALLGRPLVCGQLVHQSHDGGNVAWLHRPDVPI
jgi:hypothetical protein